MKSLIPLRYRRVLWCTATDACLLSGFIFMTSKIQVPAPKGSSADLLSRSAAVLGVAHGSHSNPVAFAAGLLIPMKMISDSDLIPVTGSEAKLIRFRSEATLAFLWCLK